MRVILVPLFVPQISELLPSLQFLKRDSTDKGVRRSTLQRFGDPAITRTVLERVGTAINVGKDEERKVRGELIGHHS